MYIFYHFIIFLNCIISIKKRKPNFFLPKNGGSKGVSKSSNHFKILFLNLFFQLVKSWACPLATAESSNPGRYVHCYLFCVQKRISVTIAHAENPSLSENSVQLWYSSTEFHFQKKSFLLAFSKILIQQLKKLRFSLSRCF
ncbi:MAG TPA: hypothetical protein DEB71_22180 [Chryseobacterium carnipullorum]|nr:hypothetical protein [Chryseobacterium carnipullorum]